MEIKKFKEYLQYEKRYSEHTLKNYCSDLEQFFVFIHSTYDDLKSSEINHHHIRSWMVELIENDNSTTSIKRKLSSLKTYFRFLMKSGKLETNPATKIQAPKVQKKLPVFVEEKQIKNLFEKIPYPEGFIGERDRLMLEFFYALGLRRAELIDLKTSAISKAQKQVKILGKGNKERIMPLDTALLHSLDKYLEARDQAFDKKNEYLFVTEKNKPMYPKLVYQIVNKYLSLITTLEKKSPHVLRHTFATHLLNNGADINAIKELLGHSSLAATQVYTHNDIQKLKSIYKQAHPKA